MKIVFLDIDGVLNSGAWFNRTGNPYLTDNKWLNMLDPEAVERLDRILERSGANVVISSSWRHAHAVSRIVDFLRLRGLTNYNRIIGRTKSFGAREYEIAAWLGEHPNVKHFVAIDDMSLPGLEKRHVHTTWGNGLVESHVKDALAILER
jgi:hypothetical protein